MVTKITCIAPTWLKKEPLPSESLEDNQKIQIPVGKFYLCTAIEQLDKKNPHMRMTSAYNAGEWFIFPEHWKIEEESTVETTVDSIDWKNWDTRVSKYFTVGEVTKYSLERVPTDRTIKQRILNLAEQLDDVREWYGEPLTVTSWFRPWAVNRRIGSNAPNHPNGWAADLKPTNGSIWDLQSRFKSEWYDTGRWSGGFGLGATKGFIHLDLDKRRIWNY